MSPVVVDGAPLHEEVVPEDAEVVLGDGAVAEAEKFVNNKNVRRN